MTPICKATLVWLDDHGDNETTIHCEREAGHKGKHKETGEMIEQGIVKPYKITWTEQSKPA